MTGAWRCWGLGIGGGSGFVWRGGGRLGRGRGRGMRRRRGGVVDLACFFIFINFSFVGWFGLVGLV